MEFKTLLTSKDSETTLHCLETLMEANACMGLVPGTSPLSWDTRQACKLQSHPGETGTYGVLMFLCE